MKARRTSFAGLEASRCLVTVLTVNLNASAEELRTGKRVQHEVLVH